MTWNFDALTKLPRTAYRTNDVERQVAERKMNTWTLELCEAVQGLQSMADDWYVVLYSPSHDCIHVAGV